MNAVEALREFGRRVALANMVHSKALLFGGPLRGRARLARDQLFVLARDLTGAQWRLIADAFCVTPTSVFAGVRRHRRRGAAAEAATRECLDVLARDSGFLARLEDAVVAENARRTDVANASRSDALYFSSQRPAFQLTRLSRLHDYFDRAGHRRLAERSRGNRWAANRSASACPAQPN